MRAKSRILPVVAALVGSVAVAMAVWAYWRWATAKHASPAKPGLPRPEALLKLPYEEFRAKWFQVTEGMSEEQKKAYAETFKGCTVEWSGQVFSAYLPTDGTVACCGWAVPLPQQGWVAKVQMRGDSQWTEMALCGLSEEDATKLQKGQIVRFDGVVAGTRWRGRYVGFVLGDLKFIP